MKSTKIINAGEQLSRVFLLWGTCQHRGKTVPTTNIPMIPLDNRRYKEEAWNDKSRNANLALLAPSRRPSSHMNTYRSYAFGGR